MFARGCVVQVAIKFHLNTATVGREHALYTTTTVRQQMLAVKDIKLVHYERVWTPEGQYVFPPFVVLERGLTLKRLARSKQGSHAMLVKVRTFTSLISGSPCTYASCAIFSRYSAPIHYSAI